MAKLKIYTFPDSVLAQKAKPLERVDRSIHRLADDMLETMYDAPGIGLAANQVGVLDRIIVVDVDYELEDLEEETEKVLVKKNPTILINPKIIYKEGHIAICEGCLSVPDYSEEVDRSQKIKVEYRDVDGLTKVLDAEDLMAVCIQHEIDHLNGKLFIDRLSPLKKDLVKKKLRAGTLPPSKKKKGIL